MRFIIFIWFCNVCCAGTIESFFNSGDGAGLTNITMSIAPTNDLNTALVTKINNATNDLSGMLKAYSNTGTNDSAARTVTATNSLSGVLKAYSDTGTNDSVTRITTSTNSLSGVLK